MNKVPKVGQFVTFIGNSVTGECTGVVLLIYPQYIYDDANGRETDELLPESEWHVAMRPGTIPHKWPYGDYDTFAPQVSELRKRKP